MSISPSFFQYYRDSFLSGTFKLKDHETLERVKSDYLEMIDKYITKKQSNVWYVKDKFELSLVLIRHKLSYDIEVPKNITLPCHVHFRENEYRFEFYSLEYIVALIGGLTAAKNIVKNKPPRAIAYLVNFHGYYGYTFSLGNSWRKFELLKPYEERNHQYIPITTLRTAILILSDLKGKNVYDPEKSDI